MKLKSQRDFWSGLLFVLVGQAFAWGSTGHDFGTSAAPGPGLFPFGLGVLLALLGGLVLFKSLAIESEGGTPVSAVAWRPLVLIPTAVGLFGYILPYLGLIFSVPVLVLMSILAAGGLRWRTALPAAAMASFASWAILVWSLKLPLRLWPLVLGLQG